MNKNNKKSNGKKTLILIIVLPLVAFFLLLIIGLTFLFSKLFNSPINKENKNDPIQISQTPDPKELNTNAFKSFDNKELENYKYEWLNKKYFKEDSYSGIITYKDPINGVKFVDYSYGKDPETKKHRYFLGKEGLAYLAMQFYDKVTFGPEIINLHSINVNDFETLPSDASGIYIPNFSQIYLNGKELAEKGLPLEQKVYSLIEILFHEYQHHWAASYVSYGSKLKNDDKSVSLKYRSFNDPRDSEVWNKYFVDGYKELLHYDFDYKFNNYRPYSLSYSKSLANTRPKNAINSIFSLKELFDYSNTPEDFEFLKLDKKLKNYSEVEFKNEILRSKYQILTKYDTKHLSYYYSMAELVPREWQKFTYVPYYLPLDLEIKRNFQKINSDLRLKLKQNYYGTMFEWLKKGYEEINYSAYASDWSRTVANGTPWILDWKNNVTINNNYEAYVYPNSVWGSTYRLRENDIWKTYKFEPTYQELYDRFLETMFYGKPFSQIKSNVIKNINNTVPFSLLDMYRITGYLPSNDFKYLAYTSKNKKNTTKKVELKYLKYINYNVKNSPFDSKRQLTPHKLNSKKYDEKYHAYYSDYFEINDVDLNKPIYFIKVDPKTNKEIKYDSFKANDIPSYRYLISSDYSIYGKYGFKTKQIIYDNGNIKFTDFE